MSKKLDSVLAKIQKDYKIEIKSVNETCRVPSISLDSPSLNYVFGGNFKLSKIYAIHGPFASGKSSLSGYIAAQIQKKYNGHNTCVWFDFEYSFSDDLMKKIGVDLENDFILIRPDNGEEAFEMMKELIETDEVGLIVIDSASVIPSKAQMEDPNKPNFGSAAKLMANGLRFINSALTRHNCSMIILGQERQNIGALFGPDWKASFSGQATDFYSSWMGRLTRIEDIKDGDDVIGIKIRIRNEKSRFSNPKRKAEINFYFNRGIDSENEYLDYLTKLNLIERKGAWYNNEEWGMHVQGMNGVADFLHSNPELYEKVKKQVNDLICGHTILDNEDSEEDEEDTNYNPETGEVIEN